MNPSEVLTVWIALTPASSENGDLVVCLVLLLIVIVGTLEYAKGSHKWPIQTTITQDVRSCFFRYWY